MATPCPSVGDRSWWDSDILGSVFFLSPMLLIMCVPTYFVKVLAHGDVHVFRYQLDTFPGWLPSVRFRCLVYSKGLWSPGNTQCAPQIRVWDQAKVDMLGWHCFLLKSLG